MPSDSEPKVVKKKKRTSRSQVAHNFFVSPAKTKRSKVMILLLKARAGGVEMKSSYSVLLASLSKDLVRETGHARVPREVWGLNWTFHPQALPGA